MEEKLIEIKEILLELNNLKKEINNLDILIIEHEKEIEKLEEKINNYTFNIRDRIEYLNKEKQKTKENIKKIKLSKKKLKIKIIITLFLVACLSTSLTFNNYYWIVCLITTLIGTGTIILNIKYNKKIEEELNRYNTENLDKAIEEENNKINKKNQKRLKPLLEMKSKASNKDFLLRKDRMSKRKELVHLEKKRDNLYKELFKVMEEEIEYSNTPLEGQLEIPEIKRIKSR